MLPIYCNNCFSKRDSKPDIKFKLTRCHHIICASCMPKSTDGDRKCPVCNRSLSAVTITHDMPSNVANYFLDPIIFFRMYQTISKFQSKQRIIHYTNFYKQKARMAKKKRKLQGYRKLQEQLLEQNETETKRIAELRDYIDYHERREEELLPDTSLSSTDISSTARMMCRPRTPSFSTTDTTPTDSEIEMSDSYLLEEFNKLLSQATSTTSTRKSVKKRRKGRKPKLLKFKKK